MTVTTIQAETGHVVLMAEGYGLLRSHVLSSDVRGALKLEQRCSNRRKKKNSAKDAGARQRIGTAVKDLCHESINLRNRRATAPGHERQFPTHHQSITSLMKNETHDYNKSGEFSHPWRENS